MSLYPLKITEITQDCKIQNLKQNLEKTFDHVSQNPSEFNSSIRELRNLSFNLYSECMVAYEKEKMRNKDLRYQFDQVQSEAVSEFNLRQQDFIKQIDLFECEIRRLRAENRELYNQIDDFVHSLETFQKSFKFSLDGLALTVRSGASSGYEKELLKKVSDLQDLLRKYSDVNNKCFNQVPESLVTFEDQLEFNDSPKKSEKIQDFNQRYYIKSPRAIQETLSSKTSLQVSYDQNPVRLRDNQVMYISDKIPKNHFPIRDSVSSLNTFLEDTYRKTAPSDGWLLKENISPIKIPDIDLKSCKDKRKISKDYLETFRTGSEVQIEGEDSFITIQESPKENTMSTIFPALEDSPGYKFRL